MTTYPIVALADGEITDPAWFADITAAVNDHQTRTSALETATFKPLYKRRTSDLTRTSTSLAADDTLFLTALTANVEYDIYCQILAKSASSVSYQVDFSLPSGASIPNCYFHSQATNTMGLTNANGSVTGITNVTGNQVLLLRGTLIMGASSGTFSFRWAPSTASGSTVSAHSVLIARQVTFT